MYEYDYKLITNYNIFLTAVVDFFICCSFAIDKLLFDDFLVPPHINDEFPIKNPSRCRGLSLS